MKPLTLRVASPCPEKWESMQGDERVRHCDKCRLNVFNLSGMSRTEVDALLGAAEGRVCGRFFQRRDGTVMTKDCPVGLRRVRLKVGGALVAAVTMAAFAVGLFSKNEAVEGALKSKLVAVEDELRENSVVGPLIEWLDPAPPRTVTVGVIMNNSPEE